MRRIPVFDFCSAALTYVSMGRLNLAVQPLVGQPGFKAELWHAATEMFRQEFRREHRPLMPIGRI